MKTIGILICLVLLFCQPVQAQQIQAPEAPDEAAELMPEEQDSFARDLWYVLCAALKKLEPELVYSIKLCLAAVCTSLLVCLAGALHSSAKTVTELVGTVAIAVLYLKDAGLLIRGATDAISQLSDYAKLLLPVMGSALAAQGGVTSSTTLYTGTAVFDALLSGLISKLISPMIYIFLALSIGYRALGDQMLDKFQRFIKWAMTWCLKTLLYVFTGYMTITGVVSGTADQAALKATKLTISGMVPVVGSILSDASEAVVVGAGAVKNAVGIYGLVAIFAIAVSPFLKIGIHYLLLKIGCALCSVFGSKSTSGLMEDLSSAMGLLLGMTGAVCLMLTISLVCFMKGMS